MPDSGVVARRNNTCIYLKQRLSKYWIKPSISWRLNRSLIYFDYFSKKPLRTHQALAMIRASSDVVTNVG
jgi:hypothetical protein